MNKHVIIIMLTGVTFILGQMEVKAQSDLEIKTELNENETVMNAILYLEIKGMHCQAGCANGIDAMLKEQDGIIKSETSFDRSSAVIEYDSDLISEKKIVELITERGFEVEIIPEKGDMPKH